MSDLSGHFNITQSAVMEFSQSEISSPIASGFRLAGLPQATVARDILDILCLGHWADFGQKHHFMRRFDGQSPYEAYLDASAWIHSNAFDSAQQLSSRIQRLVPRRHQQHPNHFQVYKLFQNASWQSLGFAIHALEDSFAAGHVTRADPSGDFQPGEIEHIKRYAGEEKAHHVEGDEAWWDESSNGFTQSGRLAKNAVKALLKIVLDTALTGGHPTALQGWTGFRDTWLRPSPRLSRDHDRIFELIDQFYLGVRLGASNIKTINFDEDGLARALLNESSATVLQVFERLDEHYNSDADDVAEIYANLVKARGGVAQQALAANKALVGRLIKVMQEGWTSDGEKQCIDFLKSL